jgi:arginine deiminase
MHLDTYFNLPGPGLAVLSRARAQSNPRSALALRADVYRRVEGRYVRERSDVAFPALLRELGFKLVTTSDRDQSAYAANFLATGTREILGAAGPTRSYRRALARNSVAADWLALDALTAGFGSAHCATQVLVRAEPGSLSSALESRSGAP